MTGNVRQQNVIQQYLLSRDAYYGWFVVARCFFVLLCVFDQIEDQRFDDSVCGESTLRSQSSKRTN